MTVKRRKLSFSWIDHASLTVKVHEIDGCIQRMHCSRQDHDEAMIETNFEFDSKDGLPVVPKCRQCGHNLRPNIRYRNEPDSELYFDSETVEKFVQEADCMVMIGQSMITLQSKRLVAAMLDREKPVIEINACNLVNRGNNIFVKGPIEQTTQDLMTSYKNLIV